MPPLTDTFFPNTFFPFSLQAPGVKELDLSLSRCRVRLAPAGARGRITAKQGHCALAKRFSSRGSGNVGRPSRDWIVGWPSRRVFMADVAL
jgi:hypothetical protein